MRSIGGRLAVLIVAATLIVPSVAFADFVSAPVTGAAIVTDAQFVNVYLFPDPDRETWDQHLATLHFANVDPADTSENIDGFLRALTASGSHYWDALMQYRTTCFLCTGRGIHPPAFFGTERTLQKCVDAAMHDATNGAVQYATLRTFAGCEVPAGGIRVTQINILVSPDINVAEFGGVKMCTPGAAEAGYHGFGMNVPNFTVIPVAKNCNPMFANLTQTISHEMVETVSDPAGFGYIHETSAGRFTGNNTAEFNQGELGDICNGGPMNPGSNPRVAFVPFTFRVGVQTFNASVSTYWSNLDNACVPTQFVANPGTTVSWTAHGSPQLVRFTGGGGGTHDFPIALPTPAGDAGKPVQAIIVTIVTGGDDLRGGSGPNENANIILTLASGATLRFNNINQGKAWESNETHSVNLAPLPATLKVNDLVKLTLDTNFSGGCCGDNWDVNQIVVQASVGP